jgi:hypothetical protein
MASESVRIHEIAVGDDADGWRNVGFAMHGDVSRVGTVRIRCVGAEDAGPSGRGSGRHRGRGIVGWDLAPGSAAIDGLPTLPEPTLPEPALPEPALPSVADAGSADPDADAPVPPHPNGVVALDHLVVVTPDLDRTTAALEAVGIAARRTREAGRGRLQRFFRLGEVVLELVGPAEPAGDGPATFWGLAFTVGDIDATAAHLAGRIGAAKQAVQPGRRIATLHAGDAVSVPVAFMSRAESDPAVRPGHGDR